MPSFEAIAQRQSHLIRKALGGIIAVAPTSVALPPALTSGTAEVQTVTITGAPTGGTFTLTLVDQTTAAIAYNATAADVATAVAALSNVGAGNVTGSGGPLPGTAVTLTFSAALGNVAEMTATSALTGGTTPAVTVATTTEGAPIELLTLPAGYDQLGYVTKDDGITFPRETENSDTTSWGAIEPTRRDIVSDVRSASFTCQETNRRVLEMYENVDLSAVEADTATGETTFNSTSSPATTYRRMIFLSYDGAGDDRIFIAKIMPRASVSEASENAWSDQNELAYPMTVTAFRDSDAGYAVRHVFGGPGWSKILTDAGFVRAAA
jgi:hypothetical protein